MEKAGDRAQRDGIAKSILGRFLALSFGQRRSDVQPPRRGPQTGPLSRVATPDVQDCLENESSSLCYPNCDLNVWLRSCESEIVTPLGGTTTGVIPVWINGSLYRNGPGKQRYKKQTVNHLFDASGLLHKFHVRNGQVTYQSRYVQSKSFLRNMAAQQLVTPEFTTRAALDPCETIFHKIKSLFVLDRVVSDNAMISIYPLGDELYAFAEAPFVHRIDPVTMDTIGHVNLRDAVGITLQSSHPHITEDEGAFSLGQTIGAKGSSYVIVNYPPPSKWDSGVEKPSNVQSVHRGRVVSRTPCREPTEPSYMHSFSITKSYFVLIEQSLTVRLKSVIGCMITGRPLVSALKWRQQLMTRIRLISRHSGLEEPVQYLTEAFFFLHTINAFEQDGHVVIDICCYKDAKMLDCMYLEALKSAQRNPNYATLFRGRPKRFVLPLKPQPGAAGNLNTFPFSASEAHWLKDKCSVLVQPDELCHLGCETPQINYNKYNGLPYRYFYAISSDVDADNPGTLIKVDTRTKKCWTWSERDVYASEPIFIPNPEAKEEDDGVVLSSLIWGKEENEKRAGLLVLDASRWTEIGRTEFRTPSPVPKCLHGYFCPAKE